MYVSLDGSRGTSPVLSEDGLTIRGEGAQKQRETAVQLLQRPSVGAWSEFTCLNSLRDVEPTVRLIMNDGGLDRTADDEDALAPPPAPSEGEVQQ